MSGFQFYNEQGIETVNSNDPTMVVLVSGKRGSEVSKIPWPAWPEPPTIFIRPEPDIFLGGFFVTKSTINGDAVVTLGTSFDWVACCSSTNPAVNDRGSFGMETFDADGEVVFSSSSEFVRLAKIVSIDGPSGNSDGQGHPIPNSVSFDGFSEMPWINVRDACLTYPHPAEGGGSYSESFVFSINSSFNVLTVNLSDTLLPGYNQYYGKKMYFPVGYIDSGGF